MEVEKLIKKDEGILEEDVKSTKNDQTMEIPSY